MFNFFISKSRFFILLEALFLVTVFISSFFENFLKGKSFYLLFFISFIILLFVLFWEKKNYRIILFIILFLFLGVWRFSLNIYEERDSEISSLNDTNEIVELNAYIKNNPESSRKNQKFIVKIKSANNQKYKGNMLVFSELYPAFFYGDILNLKCKIKSPEPIENFPYDKYLAMKNIYSICYYPEVKIISRNQGNYILASIYKLKNNFRNSINKNLSEPHSAIVGAMVLGNKNFLSDDLRLQFSRAGISHIIAISGMHIGVFILVLGAFFFYIGLNRNLVFYLTIVFLLFYNIVIAFPASSMRASFMGILLLYAFKIGRLNKIFNSIIFTATILIFINPMYIRYDFGFIFSFLSLLGIVYFFPVINSFFKQTNNRFLKYSKDIIIASISAQIFIFPLLVKNFGIFSVISPLVNLLIIWTLPFILMSSVLAFLLSFIFSSFSFYLFLPTKLLVSYILLIVDYANKIPFGSISIENPSTVFFYLYYLFLFYIIYRLVSSNRNKEKFY